MITPRQHRFAGLIAISAILQPSLASATSFNATEILTLMAMTETSNTPIIALNSLGTITGPQTYSIFGTFDNSGFSQSITGGNGSIAVDISYSGLLSEPVPGQHAMNFVSSGLVGTNTWNSSGFMTLDSIIGDTLTGTFSEEGEYNPIWFIPLLTWVGKAVAAAVISYIVVKVIEKVVEDGEEKQKERSTGTQEVTVTASATTKKTQIEVEGGQPVRIRFDTKVDRDQGTLESTVSVSPIPLPAALPLMVAAFAGLFGLWRRRRAALQ